MRFSPNMQKTQAAPIMAVRGWLADHPPPPGLPLIDLSQAAPSDPPPLALRQHIAELIRTEAETHLYGPVLGLPDLRHAIAQKWSQNYTASLDANQIAVTSGCNQAFCAAINAVAAPGDNVILPAPWYFNHKMHLDMAGIETRVLQVGADMCPCPEAAAALIDARTRAIVLVSPNNPTGAEYPPALISQFADLARDAGLALIIDETYRDYYSAQEAPHRLFDRADWADVAIHLYSFSKSYRLTGHRVGALLAGEAVIAQVEKYLDTVSICANQIAQRAALFGLQALDGFLAADRQEVITRRNAARAHLNTSATRLLSSGAFFATVAHNFDADAVTVAKTLLSKAGVLCLPMTMFAPMDSPEANRALRIAFANVDAAALAEAAQRIERCAPTCGLVLRPDPA